MLKKIICLSLSVCSLISFADVVEQKTFLNDVKDFYIGQYSHQLPEKEKAAAPINPFVYLLKPKDIDPFVMQPAEKAITALNIIYPAYQKEINSDAKPNPVDIFFLKKINILTGPGNSEFEKINNSFINTVFGSTLSPLTRCWIAFEFAQPTNNVELLLNRQHAIKHLMSNSVSNNTIKKIVKKLNTLEHSLLNFWHTKPMINEFIHKQTYFESPQFNKLNKSTLKYFIVSVLSGLFTAYQTVSLAPIVYSSYKQADSYNPYTIYQTFLESMYKGVYFFFTNKEATYTNKAKVISNVTGLYLLMIQYFNAMGAYNFRKEFTVAHESLIDLSLYLQGIRLIKKELLNNTNLLKTVPALQAILDLDNKQKHSDDFNTLIDLLKTNTFKGDASIFSIMGRVKAAYKIMEEVKDEFIPLLQAVAELSTYSALADVMQQNNICENKYCFAEFSSEQGPYITAQNFWNPMVGRMKAVANSLVVTPNQKEIVLHGPNTGGKTTTILGIMYNVLLAQTFGIASAESLIFTPFSKLNCFMDIQDDVSAGTSLFKAEVLKAKELLNNVKALNKDQYAFIIADEILRSTTPTEGEHASCKFAQKLADFDNNASIIVSHYPKMAQLSEIDPRFRTMHVEVLRNADGSFTRTFKLKDGITHENVAMDILQQEGIFE